MRTIEIDFDVHQRIEAERTSFEDSPNDALRRLLDLAPREQSGTARDNSSQLATESGGRRDAGWHAKGVTLPHGTELQVRYSEVMASGQVVEDHLVFNSKHYRTPSAAVMGVVNTARGSAVSAINGWKYLYARLPGRDKWVTLDTIRDETGRNPSGVLSLDDF